MPFFGRLLYLNSKNGLFRFFPIQKRVKRSDFAMTRKRDKEAKRKKKKPRSQPYKTKFDALHLFCSYEVKYNVN